MCLNRHQSNDKECNRKHMQTAFIHMTEIVVDANFMEIVYLLESGPALAFWGP